MVELVDPFECGELGGFKGTPWSTPVDHFGFVKAIDGLGQNILIAITEGSMSDSARRSVYFINRYWA